VLPHARPQILWVLQPQLARRNLTDEQRALTPGRLYNMLKLKRGRPDEKGEKFSPFSGSHATSRRNLTDEQRALTPGRLYNQLKLKHGRPDEKVEKFSTFSGNHATSRRNLTDEQRTVVLGRLYNQLKLKQGRPDEKEEKFSSFSGQNATSRRNLTDEQRALTPGRLYNQLKLRQHRPENGVNLTPFSGEHAHKTRTICPCFLEFLEITPLHAPSAHCTALASARYANLGSYRLRDNTAQPPPRGRNR